MSTAGRGTPRGVALAAAGTSACTIRECAEMGDAAKWLLIAGARPNFMKVAPLIWELASRQRNRSLEHVRWKLVHTGQHYDYNMSRSFFEDLDLPEPDHFLGGGSGTHAEQTAKIMVGFEGICVSEVPELVLVVGDVNSTLACAITAKKLHARLAHVEAGLRSGDMAMPEEVNRVVTDAIADELFVTERSGVDNLRREGKRDSQIHFVGNVMIDTMKHCLEKLDRSPSSVLYTQPYAVLTLHRPATVDDAGRLRDILESICSIADDMAVYFPIHPRTEGRMKEFGLLPLVQRANIVLLPPQSYLRFLALSRHAAVVLTDSGGLQEETTVLGIPCLTIRDTTERPITIDQGTNRLVGTTGKGIREAYRELTRGRARAGRIPDLWDGCTAARIVDILIARE